MIGTGEAFGRFLFHRVGQSNIHRFMKTSKYIVALIGIIFLARLASVEEEKWTELLDPNLSQRELWLVVPNTSVKGLPKARRSRTIITKACFSAWRTTQRKSSP